MALADDLIRILKKLRLSGVLQTLDLRIKEAVDSDLSHTEFLFLLCSNEAPPAGLLRAAGDGIPGADGAAAAHGSGSQRAPGIPAAVRAPRRSGAPPTPRTWPRCNCWCARAPTRRSRPRTPAATAAAEPVSPPPAGAGEPEADPRPPADGSAEPAASQQLPEDRRPRHRRHPASTRRACRRCPRTAPGFYLIHAASGVGYGQGFAGNSHRHVPDGWLPALRYLIDELGADVNARDLNGYRRCTTPRPAATTRR